MKFGGFTGCISQNILNYHSFHSTKKDILIQITNLSMTNLAALVSNPPLISNKMIKSWIFQMFDPGDKCAFN